MCNAPISEGDARLRWFDAGLATRFAEGVLVPVTIEGEQLLLVRDHGAIHAVERACPHEQADLAEGHCSAGRLHCPRHQASFDLVTGEVSRNWLFRALRTFAVRVAQERIFVGLP